MNANFLERVTVLEMPETGGELVCIHGSFGAAKTIDAYVRFVAITLDN